MKLLKRRNRPSIRGKKDGGTAGSLSCLPRSCLCRGLPPSSPPTAKASSFTIMPVASSELDEINHDDRSWSEQPGKNGVTTGAALLGGDGLQHYERFIATLLRERSVVKDGVAATAANHSQVNKARSLTTRLRKRRTVADKAEDVPKTNSAGNGSLRVERTKFTRKPVDQSLFLKSVGQEFSSPVSRNGEICVDRASLDLRDQPRTKVDVYGTKTIDATGTRDTSIKVDTMEHSPRQRRRRRKQNDRYHGGALNVSCGDEYRPDGCSASASYTRVPANYQLSQRSNAAVSNDARTEIPTHCDKALLGRQQCYSGSLDENSAFCDRFGGLDDATLPAMVRHESIKSAAATPDDSEPRLPSRTDEVAVDRHQNDSDVIVIAGDRSDGCNAVASDASDNVDCELSQQSTAIVSRYFEPELSPHFDQAEVDLLHRENVFGLTVDASTIHFIDCDERIELFNQAELQSEQQLVSLSQTDRTSSASLSADPRRNAENKLMALSPSLRASSLQSGRPMTVACVCDDLQTRCCTVCRQSSTHYDERGGTVAVRLRTQSRSQPSLSRSLAGSALDRALGQPTRDGVRRSQLLETCRCSIAWPLTAMSCVVEAEDLDNDDIRRSWQLTRGLVRRKTETTNAFTAPQQLKLQLSSDVRHPLTDRRHRHPPDFVNLPSNNVAHTTPWSYCGDIPTYKVGVARRAVQVFCVFGRHRLNSRCGRKASKCSLRIEFVLTRLQTTDQKTMLLFGQRRPPVSTAEERGQITTDNSEVLHLPHCRSSTCSTSDVILTVISDDIQSIDLARNCAVECTLSVSQPSAVACGFNTSPKSTYSSDTTLQWTADWGTVSDVTRCEVTFREIDDVSQSLIVYEFAEVTSIFRKFADDLLPTTDWALSLVPCKAARRREDRSRTTALVCRAEPGLTYSGAVMPYGRLSPVFVPLPLMTWTWNCDDFTGSNRQATNDDVIHIPYVSACTTINIELSIDYFTLITPPFTVQTD